MIEIPRGLARRFRAVLRRSVLAADPRGPCPLVLCLAGKDGLTLSCEQAGVGLRHHDPRPRTPAAVCVPASVLADVEGRGDEPALLEQASPSRGRASWRDAGELRVLEFDTADPASLPGRHAGPAKLPQTEPGLLAALDEAARTAARDRPGSPISRVLLRGRDGAVVGTDGRQLLIHSGFPLPWKDDVLIPALPAFGCREVAPPATVGVGLQDDWVLIQAGPWSFALRSEEAKRYPDVDSVVPKGGKLTRLALHADDVDKVVAWLPPARARDREVAAVTLDLADRPAVLRVKEKAGEVAETRLGRSTLEGPPVRAATDRRYLLRALALGFTAVVSAGPGRPLHCRDGRRCYVWMQAESSSVIPPASPDQRSSETMPDSERKQPSPGPAPARGNSDPPDPLAEAESLRAALSEALARTSRLIATLKQHRRESRAVKAAVASLRRLRQLDE